MVDFDHFSDTCMLASITDAVTSKIDIIFHGSADHFLSRITVIKYERNALCYSAV